MLNDNVNRKSKRNFFHGVIDYEKATYHLQRAKTLAPEHADNLFYLGKIYFKMELYLKANQELKRFLELAKIVCDTSYYGWLINYAQLSNLIAKKHKVNYDEMWSFSDEIHKFLGNRPKMFPGFIGGHCVIPNLELINEEQLWQIDRINNLYARKVKNTKSIAKKYVKGKQSYNV